jgi:hypothetical protein
MTFKIAIREVYFIWKANMFEQENRFYEENRDNLRERYLGKEIVIIQDQIIGAYDDVGQALQETTKTHPLGSFCIKSIPVDPNEEYQRFLLFL